MAATERRDQSHAMNSSSGKGVKVMGLGLAPNANRVVFRRAVGGGNGSSLSARRVALVSLVVSATVLAALLVNTVWGNGGGDGCSEEDYLFQSATLTEECRRRRSRTEGRKPPKLIIDVLSIGSLERLGFLERQRAGWASGRNVRFFWGASELDDANPTCAVEVEMEDVVEHAISCHKAPVNATFAMDFFKREEDPFGYVMKRKGNVPGWFCAQRRQGQSLSRVGALYRNLTAKGGSLPDYLLLVDDDTYVNIPLLSKYLEGIDTNVPLVYAGCLFPKKISFPFGGFGLFYSKGAISRMIRPIHCRETSRGFEADVCIRLREDLMGERSMFRDGMSISDLMAAFSSSDKLCMHSDWVTGYFVNIYGLSKMSEAAPVYQRFGYDRVHALSGMKFGPDFKKHVANHCSSRTALVCHKVTPHPGETEADAMAREQDISARSINDRTEKIKAFK